MTMTTTTTKYHITFILLTLSTIFFFAEALALCKKYDSKFIEVSCAINHQIDEMLVGIVTQIRLNKKRRRSRFSRRASDGGDGGLTCMDALSSMLETMFGPKKQTANEYDNLLVL